MQTQLVQTATPDLSDDARRGWKIIGAITALETVGHNIQEVCSAEAIRGIERIENENLYLAMGFSTFAEFLESDDCFIGRTSYYERRDLLRKEGPSLYDVLNGLDISMRKRKQLGKGTLELDEDGTTLIITDTEERVSVNDRERLLELLTITVDSNREKNAKIEKGEADIRRLREKLFDAETESSPRSAIPDLDKAHMVASGAVAALADEISRLDARDAQQYLDGPMNLLAIQYQRLNDALARTLGTLGEEDDL